MPMQEALYQRFSALPSLAGAQVAWTERPRRDALPHVLLTSASPGEEWEHDGPDALTQPRIQADIWAEDEETVTSIARAIRAELMRTEDVVVAGIRFQPPAIIFSDRDSKDPLAGGSDLFRRTIDFMQWVRPA